MVAMFRIPKIKSPAGIVLGIPAVKREKIPAAIKKEVYTRAKKRCECCGKPMKISQGEFHHHRKPTIKPTAKTVQFLCASDQ